MKKILPVLILLLFTVNCFGQQFAQYNTGTLYDSFENLSQRSFIPDSSRKYAFNFFLPNLSVNSYLKGNAQVPLKTRAFSGYYTADNLKVGPGNVYNRVNANVNNYWVMFKVFTSLEGNSEVGVSLQTRAEGRGLFTDETVALYAGPGAFPKDHYDDIFNNTGTYQAYHQASFTYREKLSKKFAVGIKLSALMGIRYQKATVTSSSIDFDRANDAALLSMTGRYYLNYNPGPFNSHDYLPTFRNPGAAIGIGTSLRTRDNFNLQFNFKDVGFIHWSSRSTVYNFASADTIFNLSTSRRENNIYDAVKNIAKTNVTVGSFTTPTNGKFEVSANKQFWLDYDNRYKYSPTLILSKELFFDGFTAALVNPFQYKNYVVTLTTAYDNNRVFSLGGQFMIKSPNAEFFIGSERFLPTASTALAGLKSNSQINKNAAYTAVDLFLGVSFKFGPVIEHPLNASFIPTENSPGFIKRLYNRIFGKDNGD
ncbi:hypothetical protein DYU05_01450 [Mucilaginibacter terrenus]|uniref:DUF5723 domain-containing protein n=1 Tax=Mucilaginibacter terrenus TaxID=2482727 RepID=A0A3E2NTM0_9SPHI|nr:DUF5723 family protein [Mucilaginibacter terrenus]RFZ84319.1 hypothetical protein DYU05_01450 [Mucilaginibacter terrenus]